MAIRQWFTFEHVPVARDVSPNQCALAANARRRHHVNALKLCGPVGDAEPSLRGKVREEHTSESY